MKSGVFLAVLTHALLSFYCTYKVSCCYRAEHKGSCCFLSFGMWHQVSLPLNCALEDLIFEIAVLLTDWGFIKKIKIIRTNFGLG